MGGPAIATGSSDACARLWTSEGKLIDTLYGHGDRLGRIAFHPSGRLLATASFDLTWRLWDLKTSSPVLAGVNRSQDCSKLLYEQEGHTKPVYAIAFQCDGSLLASGGLDGLGRVWDI